MVDISWFGGLINFTIPTYVIIGIILIILGVLVGAFVPNIGRKMGIITFLTGLVMITVFPLISEWWQNDIFKVVVIVLFAIALVIAILFWGIPTPKGGRRK